MIFEIDGEKLIGYRFIFALLVYALKKFGEVGESLCITS